jgi:hypothetical protein
MSTNDLTAEELKSLQLIVHPSSVDEVGEQAYHSNELRRVQRELWILRPRILAQLQRLTALRCETCLYWDDFGLPNQTEARCLLAAFGPKALWKAAESCSRHTPKTEEK